MTPPETPEPAKARDIYSRLGGIEARQIEAAERGSEMAEHVNRLAKAATVQSQRLEGIDAKLGTMTEISRDMLYLDKAREERESAAAEEEDRVRREELELRKVNQGWIRSFIGDNWKYAAVILLFAMGANLTEVLRLFGVVPPQTVVSAPAATLPAVVPIDLEEPSTELEEDRPDPVAESEQ